MKKRLCVGIGIVFLGLLFLGIFLISQPKAQAQTPISACGTLGTAGMTYELNQDLISSGTCFTIGAGNVTLDGKGHKIIYATGGSGYGIDLQSL